MIGQTRTLTADAIDGVGTHARKPSKRIREVQFLGKTQYGEVVLGRGSSQAVQRSEETLAALTHRRAAQEGERVRVSPGRMTYWKKQ